MNIVAHNLTAMNAQRQFGINTRKRAKSTEKLSSGYKINRAADDAAGLTISEKMRSQIRGLTQGVENTQDGVSLCQVADGALSEVNDMLHRLTELSVQAANGTNTAADRQALQKEVGQIVQEIDRIGDTTTFNERYVFRDTVDGVDTDQGIGNLGQWVLPKQLHEVEFVLRNIHTTSGQDVMADGVAYPSGSDIRLTGIQYLGSNLAQVVVGNEVLLRATDTPAGSSYGVCDEPLYSIHMSDLRVEDTGEVYARAANGDKWYFGGSYLVDFATGEITGITSEFTTTNKDHGVQRVVTAIKKTDASSGAAQDTNGFYARGVWIQSGAKEGDGMNLIIDKMNTRILGIHDLNVSTEAGAKNAMEAIKGALSKVTENRSKIGAQQNRLEHTIANEENIVENTTSAESGIRDTDMAQEVVRLSNFNILEQAGYTMMAQANQNNQGVLSLLQ